MKKTNHLSKLSVAVAATLVASSAFATNGYFPHGLGMKMKGMGGAGVALAQDGFSVAHNPALGVDVGNSLAMGVDFFSPDRSTSRTMSGMSMGSVKSSERVFPIPEFAYNTKVSDKMAVGLAVYANGGMNTTYKGMTHGCQDMSGNAYYGNAVCGTSNLGVDLAQLTISPTISYKPNDRVSVGVAPMFVYQRFEAVGLQAFQGMPGASSNPDALTNTGYDSSQGLGIRFGFAATLNDKVNVGASFTPKINMSKFKSYAGLFAGEGDFDIPSSSNLGAAFKASDKLTLAADYSRIGYSKVPSIGNPMSNFFTSQMGTATGAGFGWKDINVIKIGAEWKHSATTTLRAGFNKGQNPISGANVTINILAPGVMTKHYTFGATHTMADKSEWTWAFMYAPSVSVTDTSFFGAMTGTTAISDQIQMKQYSLGVQYSKKF
ncbi:long-chain fatty acid transporter [Betaproteobacteria bacterium LSUCC0115]|nr:long-chain fatty acid transporter [Burkholderiales bacterium LSUCC0115]